MNFKTIKKITLGFACIFFLCILISCQSIEHEIPSKYDLRDVNANCYITPVKTQSVPDEWWNNVGLCWAFASLASFESSLLKQGIVSDSNAQEANLSPWHLGCYVGYNHPNYEFNHTMLGNPPVPVSYALDSTMQWGWGGSTLFTIDYLSSGKGLVLEYQAPLPLDKMKNQETLSPPLENLNMHYMLRKGLVFECEDYSSDEEFQKAIKEVLMEYGAVATPMYLGAPDFPGQIGHSYWRDENYTDYYCDAEELVNQLIHMVTIIGWDDYKPINGAPGPGAWLVKDSMGFNDHGYFWISYDDTVFLKGFSYAVALVADKGMGYDAYRYQTHLGALSRPVSSSTTYESDGYHTVGRDSWACARFLAETNGFLKAVGLITVNRNEQLTINIYQSWDEATQEPTGLLHTDKVMIKEQGYHVIDLSQAVEIQFGKEFIIAVGFTASSDKTKEPLVYVVNPEHPPENGKTYRTSFSTDKGWQPWVDYTQIHDNSVFYIQGIFSNPSGVE